VAGFTPDTPLLFLICSARWSFVMSASCWGSSLFPLASFGVCQTSH
jgi:hypothetical protein